MTNFAEAFAWCMLQVTLFSLVAAGLYGFVLRFRLDGAASLLTGSLTVVAMLTLLCLSPWPRWIPTQLDLKDGGVAHVAIAPRAIARSELRDFESERVAIYSATQDRTSGRTTADEFLTDPRRTVSRHESTASSLPTWPVVLLTAAGIAAAVGLSRLSAGAFYLWRYCRRSRPIDDHGVHELLSELVAKLAISRRVAIRESDLLTVAAMTGWRRPLVLLPMAWRAWTPAELRVVLAHELAHIEQLHFPSWALAQLPLAAHYYNPLVHWLVRRLRFEHELVADARRHGIRQPSSVCHGACRIGAPCNLTTQ